VTVTADRCLCRRKGKSRKALQRLREIMGKLKLTVTEEKTRICKVAGRRVRLPGIHVWADVIHARTRKAYLGYRPSKKSIKAAWSRRFMRLTTRSWTAETTRAGEPVTDTRWRTTSK